MDKNLWEIYTDEQLGELNSLSEGYKNFWMQEKRNVNVLWKSSDRQKSDGYRELAVQQLNPGDKVYATWMGQIDCTFLMSGKTIWSRA